MYDLDNKHSGDSSPFIVGMALWIFGIFIVYSATHIYDAGPLVNIWRSQIIWVIMGTIVAIVVISIPNRFFYNFAYVFYGMSLIMLLAALFAGEVSKGAGRWISIAGFRLQPSEFAKIGLLLALARYLSHHELSLNRLRSFIMPAMLMFIPFVMILKQPDLGTAMVLCGMALPMFFWAGLTIHEVFLLVSPVASLALSAIPLIIAFAGNAHAGITSAIPWGIFFGVLLIVLYFSRLPILISMGIISANLFTAGITAIVWNMLKAYQKMRIISFMNPQEDASGSGYQVIQSMVAIGSGHIFGKGYLKGTQTRLSFLPEQHTDFIFSVLGEQFGLIGCIAVLLLFLFIVIKGYSVTQTIKNRFTNLMIVGAVSILAFHIFINVSMVLGMMPVVGIPLPFLSYGGSFVLTVSILLGFVLSTKAKGFS